MDLLNILNNLDELEAVENEELYRQLKLQRRNLRDTFNPLELPEDLFKRSYRVSKDLFVNILMPQVEEHANQRQRSTGVPVHIRLLLTLQMLAEGQYFNGASNNAFSNMAKSTAHKYFHEMLEIFTNHLFPKYVKFPTETREIEYVKAGFEEKFRFPDVIGAIDSTHVALICPSEDEAPMYLNRKGFYSINVQAVCDANLNFLAVNARYPGSVHDSGIWGASTVHVHLESKYIEGRRNAWLLGDAGYPLQPWLLTPVLNPPENTPYSRYNEKHKRARLCVERSFGVLKSRFRAINKHRVLHFDHATSGRIVYACVTLHNLIRKYNGGENNEEEIEDVDNDAVFQGPANFFAEGRRVRDELVQRLELL